LRYGSAELQGDNSVGGANSTDKSCGKIELLSYFIRGFVFLKTRLLLAKVGNE
jgi:hypothetical protein